MTTSLLAYIPSPAQGVWHLGPVPIRAYALCIITGIIAALIIGDRRWVARGGEAGVIYDIALWTVPFGLIGGRLYHLMTDWRTYFAEGGAGIGAAVRIWDGGLGIWGAVALGGVGAWIGCRRHGIPLPAFGDAIAPGIILAQAIGRLGNYFNQELYGRPTDLPWGLQIFQRSDGSGVVNPHLLNGVSTGQVYEVVHPTFLYELLWNLVVFFFLLWADRRFRLGHGRLFALYVAAYCVGRFGVELMRSDTATLIAGIRVNSFTSTFVFIGAVVYMMVAPRGREDPATLGGRQVDDGGDVPELDTGVAVKVPAVVAAGAAATAASGGDADVADEADAVETQSDEPVALAEQAVDADATADESGGESVDSDEVEEADESDAEAEDLDADEAEAVEVAEESEGTTESDEAADEAAAETEVADADDSADVEDAAEDEESAEAVDSAEAAEEAAAETDVADADDSADVEDAAEDEESAETADSAEAADEAEEAEGTTESDADEAAVETDVADADDSADVEDAVEDEAVDESEEATDSESAETESDDAEAEDADVEDAEAEDADAEATEGDADAGPAEEPAPKVEATEKVEPVGVPVWEPPAPRRRWWRRQG